MTPEDKQFIQDCKAAMEIGATAKDKLIFLLEESQRTEQLIIKIFEAGGDLKELGMDNPIFDNNDFYVWSGNMQAYKESLAKTLEFILERTTKNE